MHITFEEGDSLFEAVKDALVDNIDTSDIEDKVVDSISDGLSIDDDIAEKVSENIMESIDTGAVLRQAIAQVAETICIDEDDVQQKVAELLASKVGFSGDVSILQTQMQSLVNTNALLKQDIVTQSHTIQSLERRLFSLEQLLGKFREVLVR
jgi:hypothetical protein